MTHPFDQPSPVLNVDGCVVVLSPNEEPGEDVPVPENADSILRDDTKDKGSGECIAKSFHLHLGDCFACGGRVLDEIINDYMTA